MIREDIREDIVIGFASITITVGVICGMNFLSQVKMKGDNQIDV